MPPISAGAQRVAICATGIYLCYLLYGVKQEAIAKRGFGDTLLLLLLQCVANAMMGLLGVMLLGVPATSKSLSGRATRSPISDWLGLSHSGHVWLASISASYVVAMAMSNSALHYVSFTALVLGKSVKMVPIMLTSMLLASQKYSGVEITAVLLISFGIFLFSVRSISFEAGSLFSLNSFSHLLALDESFVSGLIGSLLLLSSLALDGLTSTNQRLCYDEFQTSTHEQMFLMNLWSVLYLSIIILLTRDGSRGFGAFYERSDIHFDVFIFSMSSALGQNFIFYTITGPGPLVCAIITTTRKFFTILASTLLWPENSLTFLQWTGVFSVFSGLSLEIYEKYHEEETNKKLKKNDIEILSGKSDTRLKEN